jgi:hypothetical protein
METCDRLNDKILTLTLLIKDKHPELSKYLEEMPVTIPDDKHPDINQKKMQDYYDSLNSILIKYLLEQSVKAKALESNLIK